MQNSPSDDLPLFAARSEPAEDTPRKSRRAKAKTPAKPQKAPARPARVLPPGVVELVPQPARRKRRKQPAQLVRLPMARHIGLVAYLAVAFLSAPPGTARLRALQREFDILRRDKLALGMRRADIDADLRRLEVAAHIRITEELARDRNLR